VRSGGIAIPGATVTATQGDRKVVTSTDEAGRYVFTNLAPGTWTLQVEIFGFSPANREITVEEKPASADWTLALRPLSESTPVSTHPDSRDLSSHEAVRVSPSCRASPATPITREAP